MNQTLVRIDLGNAAPPLERAWHLFFHFTDKILSPFFNKRKINNIHKKQASRRRNADGRRGSEHKQTVRTAKESGQKQETSSQGCEGVNWIQRSTDV